MAKKEGFFSKLFSKKEKENNAPVKETENVKKSFEATEKEEPIKELDETVEEIETVTETVAEQEIGNENEINDVEPIVEQQEIEPDAGNEAQFENELESEITSNNEVIENTIEEISAEPENNNSEKKKGFFAKLRDGLAKTRNSVGGVFDAIFSGAGKLSDDFYDELEEAMIMADMGMETTSKLLEKLKQIVKEEKMTETAQAKQALKKILADEMRPEDNFLENADKAVILIVGVNGVGKTTSIGKLSNYYVSEGKKPLLAAADTFRAAAAEQLTVWAERADVPIVKHGEGADPAAVVFDAIASYKAKKRDYLICDTAGRLHNKKNLMDELAKIRRVIARELPDVPCEVLLVLDATTGQNAIAQAKTFGESTGLTGIILTKLDGTAKGGVVVAVKDELNLPVRFIGVGEGIDDLQPFDADAFVEALF